MGKVKERFIGMTFSPAPFFRPFYGFYLSRILPGLARLFERLLAIEVTVDLEHEQTPTVDVRVSAER